MMKRFSIVVQNSGQIKQLPKISGFTVKSSKISHKKEEHKDTN